MAPENAWGWMDLTALRSKLMLSTFGIVPRVLAFRSVMTFSPLRSRIKLHISLFPYGKIHSLMWDDHLCSTHSPNLRIQASLGRLEGNTRSPLLWQSTSALTEADLMEHLQMSGQQNAAGTVHSVITISHLWYLMSPGQCRMFRESFSVRDLKLFTLVLMEYFSILNNSQNEYSRIIYSDYF